MLEGTIVNVTDKSGPSHPKRGGSLMGSNGGASNKGETYTVDTSNILFILSGAFVGLDKVVSDRMAKGVSTYEDCVCVRSDPFCSPLDLMLI